MLIFRYERNGVGPFQFDSLSMDDDYLNSLIYEHISYELHPTPDIYLYPGEIEFENFFFGCESIEQLHLWFNDDVCFMLDRCGFELKVYDCPDEYCVVDVNQIGFVKEKAREVELV